MLLFEESALGLYGGGKISTRHSFKGSPWSIWPLIALWSCVFFLLLLLLLLNSSLFLFVTCTSMCAYVQDLSRSAIQHSPTKSVTRVHWSMLVGTCQECANKGWEKQDWEPVGMHANGCKRTLCCFWSGISVCLQFCILNKFFFVVDLLMGLYFSFFGAFLS